MSSILTNNSAMVALQTLKSINMNLGKVQNEISTGKSVESAKDNASVWAISKVMSSDVEGFKAITDLLTEIKGKIVNSQEENVDRAKVQTDIEALTNQVSSIVGAAQFNGLNLINDGGKSTDEQSASILSSLDRAGDGTVTASEIDLARANLSTDKVSLGAVTDVAADDAEGGMETVTVAATTATALNIAASGDNVSVSGGTVFQLEIAGTDSTANGGIA